QARFGQLHADADRQRRADDRHREGEQQVQGPDVLVVGREEPALDEALPVVAVVVVVVYGGGMGGGHGLTSGIRVRGSTGGHGAGRGLRGGGGRGFALRGLGGLWRFGGGGRRLDRRFRRCGRRVLRLLRGQPGAELVLVDRLDHDRHEAVVLAAQLGALAAVDARLLD